MSLVVIANLRGIDFSGSKAILLQRIIESHSTMQGNNSTTLNSGQTTENTLQEVQQAGPSDFLTENECPICYKTTREDRRIHRYRCCKQWTCMVCCDKWTDEPRLTRQKADKLRRMQEYWIKTET